MFTFGILFTIVLTIVSAVKIPSGVIQINKLNESVKFYEVPFNRRLNFQVKTSHDAIIALTANASSATSSISFLIGCRNNTETHINDVPQINNAVQVKTPNILSEEEFRSFWITWDGFGYFELGYDNIPNPFITYQTKSNFGVSFIEIRSLNTTSEWILQREFNTKVILTGNETKVGDSYNCKILNTQKIELEHINVSTPASNDFNYTYFEASTSACLSFKVKAASDVVIQLSSNRSNTNDTNNYPAVQIYIGAENNSYSAINLASQNTSGQLVSYVPTDEILSSERFQGFWLTWLNGQLKFGREWETEPLLYYHKLDLEVLYFGLLSYNTSADWLIETDGCPGTYSSYDNIVAVMKCSLNNY